MTSPNQNTPLISIALCTYNGSRFLREQLDSLLAQGYPCLEFIVSDDASTDDTRSILEGYAARDPRFKLFRNEKNVGFIDNFAHALKHCAGEFVAPCDQDDIWSADKIETLARSIGLRDLAYCDSVLVDESGAVDSHRMSAVVSMLSTNDAANFVFGNCASGHAMLFRRSLLPAVLPIPSGFFYDWWITAVAASKNGIVYCDRPLVRYRQHGSNVTRARLDEMVAAAGLVTANKSESAPRRAVSGGKKAFFDQTALRLEALANLPGRHQALLVELHRLWVKREHQWFSLRLGRLMNKHRERLFAATREPAAKLARDGRQYYWGLKAKRFKRPEEYR